MGNTTLLLNKGKRPIIQDFKGRIKSIFLLKEEPEIINKDLKVKFYQLKDLEQKILYKIRKDSVNKLKYSKLRGIILSF